MREKHQNDYNGGKHWNGIKDHPGRRESKWKALSGVGRKHKTIAVLKRERARSERRMVTIEME